MTEEELKAIEERAAFYKQKFPQFIDYVMDVPLLIAALREAWAKLDIALSALKRIEELSKPEGY